jgi:signal transduction histidine kinase
MSRLLDFRLGVQAKITLLIALFILLTSGSLSWYFIEQERKIHVADLVKTGRALTATLAKESGVAIVAQDQATLLGLINRVARDPDVAFAIVHDDHGRVLAQIGAISAAEVVGIFGSGAAAAGSQDGAAEGLVKIAAGGSRYDITAPIFRKQFVRATRDGTAQSGSISLQPTEWKSLVERVGTARVGLSLARINAEVAERRRGSILLTSIVVMLGIAGALLLTRFMVRPLRELEAATKRVADGELHLRVEARTRDEIGDLASEFNTMAAKLQEAYAGLEQKVEERTRDLREALEQQTATSEILRVISNSPTSTQPVFDAILDSAIRLCAADHGILYHYDGKVFQTIACHGLTPDQETTFRSESVPPGPYSGLGRLLAGKKPVQVADLTDDIAYRQGDPRRVRFVTLLGARSAMWVPLVKNDVVVGAMAIYRREMRAFTDKQIELVATFADQAVIAIENVRLFNELEVANRDLKAASQHKSEFLANMSHELRTPLNAIIGFSEVLGERLFGELNEKQEEYLKDIHASGQHLLSLINDILDLSKIEAGRMELELTDVYVAATLDNALTLVRERAGRRGIALHMTTDERLEYVRADERKVRQVVLNLLSNAIKFTPEGGRIEVRAKPVDGSVEVSVSDTGVGIAPEDQEAIFEEFRQVGTADKKVEGTGLGLALSRKFVELHGGRIWVKSEVGVGSTFTFTIPVRRGE